MSRKVCGHGVNDANYSTQKFVNRRLVWVCPFYQKWASMLKRCYSSKLHEKFPTYRGCFVCEEWLTFSNFKSWMEKQDYEGKHLDKDVLVAGNKMYSPATCLFVTSKVNSFLTDAKASRGDYPQGVSFHRATGKYQARCSNPYSANNYVGVYTCPLEAHHAWAKKKREVAVMLANEKENEDIKVALLSRAWEQGE